MKRLADTDEPKERRKTMRVITGTARGRKLETLEGEAVRPTTDRVKEALFSIIQFQLEGRRVLDLFAGSGQLGIEALSRGAAEAVFIDSSRAAVETVKRNLIHVKLADKAQVLLTDAYTFLANSQKPFDIALLDPPYGKGLLQEILPRLARWMNPGGVILCESPLAEELPQTAGEFSIAKEYKYGKIKLTSYRRKAE